MVLELAYPCYRYLIDFANDHLSQASERSPCIQIHLYKAIDKSVDCNTSPEGNYIVFETLIVFSYKP